MKKVHIYAAIILVLFIAAAMFIPYFVLIILGIIFLQWLYDINVAKSPGYNEVSTTYRHELTKQEMLTLYRHNKYIYLKSPYWQDKRKLILARDNCHCVDCGATHNLQVHHLRYINLGNEPLADLITLCGDCHTKRHETIGYPQSYEDYINFNDTK